jgi:hypothetical protein
MAELAEQVYHMLVVVEPRAHRRLAAVVDAVDRYHPKAAIWQYRLDGRPRLAALTDAHAGLAHRAGPLPAAPQSAVEVGPEPVDGPAAGEAVAGEPAADEPVAPVDVPPLDPGETEAAPLLTDEELSMLLGDDEEWDERRGAQ